MQNWKITLSYDGTGFHGWQVQPGLRTVQRELQAALYRVVGEAPLPQGSGRTDAGVHALGQVASFRLGAPIPAANLMRALNRTLPDAIRVLAASVVGAEFHARHSAIAKTYEYRVFRGEVCSPFLAPYVHLCDWKLNFDRLRRAASDVVGEHDFLSFAASDPDLAKRTYRIDYKLDTVSSVRTIYGSEWSESDDGSLIYRVRGNGFLHHMVRNLVGTMIEIARGQLDENAMPPILAALSRAEAGPTAPARGLFLCSVEYPEDVVTGHLPATFK